MAKKKEEEAPKGSPAWMSTFSDLMNLLMCFFVLLFSMSSVDESKAEALIKSLADTFSIFEGGGSSLDEGVLISSGSSQLSYLDEYFNQSGQTDDGDKNENVNNGTNQGQGNPGHDTEGNDNPGHETDPGNQGENPDVGQGEKPNKGDEGDKPDSGKKDELEENKNNSGIIYDDIMDQAGKYNIDDFINVKVDAKAYQYVEINISGSLLFDSGKAALKSDSMNVLSKVGDILKTYKGYKIEIIGHTDNVPMSPGKEFANNDILSAARAFSVGQFLAESKYMGWSNIYCIGRGEHEPIKDNSTAEGRAANRRVEIRLYNSKAEG